MKNKYLKIFLAGIAIPFLLGAALATVTIYRGTFVGTFVGTGSGITNSVAAYVGGTLTNSTTGSAGFATVAGSVTNGGSGAWTGNLASGTNIAAVYTTNTIYTISPAAFQAFTNAVGFGAITTNVTVTTRTP